jgi:DNA-binding LacI/PurR family transcriptional regulator
MPPTLKDVAERAGVSRAAVSRTFTDGASVSLKMRKKVEKAAAELGYSPQCAGLEPDHRAHQADRPGVEQLSQPDLSRGVRPVHPRTCRTAGCVRCSSICRMKPIPQIRPDAAAILGRCVVVASSTLPPGFAKAFRDAGVPVVHSFGRHASSPEVHVVGIDNVECGRMAARELVRRGYRDVAFLGGPESAPRRRTGFAAFMEELAQHPGISPCATPLPRPIRSMRGARKCLRGSMTSRRRPISAAMTCFPSGAQRDRMIRA